MATLTHFLINETKPIFSYHIFQIYLSFIAPLLIGNYIFLSILFKLNTLQLLN